MPIRLLSLALMMIATTACEPARSRSGGGGTRRVFMPGADAGATLDGGTSNVDAGAIDSGLPGRDAGSPPARDAGSPPGRDAGFAPPRDGGPPPPRDGGFRDAGPPAATVGLSFSGCGADFGGDIVVSYNGSIAIGSLRNHVLVSSLQFDLNGTGTKSLSTQHRIASGEVINLVVGTTWTNISSVTPDPIGGTLIVREYQPSSGRLDVEFVNVALEHVQHGGICRIDGTARATRLHP